MTKYNNYTRSGRWELKNKLTEIAMQLQTMQQLFIDLSGKCCDNSKLLVKKSSKILKSLPNVMKILEVITKDNIVRIGSKQATADESIVALKDIIYEMERLAKRPKKIDWKTIHNLLQQISEKLNILDNNEQSL